MLSTRPQPNEHDQFYSTYIDKVGEGPIIDLMESELDAALSLLTSIPGDRETYRYAPGKWTVRELLGHIVDTERVFGYRALSFAREEGAELPGMDQDTWADASNANTRPLSSLATEFQHLRRSQIELFRSFDAATFDRRGTASGFEFTVRALCYIIVGHEIHHRRVLKERYL